MGVRATQSPDCSTELPMPPRDALLEEIFNGLDSPLYAPLAVTFAEWTRASRPFLVFATANRTKIRAKIRSARDADRLADVRAELATAATLLVDARLRLEYETYIASGKRGPDFTATFRENTRFNVEVRRLRASGDRESIITKLVEVLADKIGQMPPSAINVLWFVLDDAQGEVAITLEEITNALLVLRTLAEGKVEEFFTRRGFKSASDYQKHLARLSAIALQANPAGELWLNPQARHALPNELVNALRRLV